MNIYELINFLIDIPNKTDIVCIYDSTTGNRIPIKEEDIDSNCKGTLDIGYIESEE